MKKKHDKLWNFILATTWWIIVSICSIMLMRCAISVGGAANIIAGIIILVGTAADALLGIISILAYIAGDDSLLEKNHNNRVNAFDEFVTIGTEAKIESMENKKEENKNENV